MTVLTESGLHAQHVIELAPYGADIVVEKPMALTLEDADKMIETCDRHAYDFCGEAEIASTCRSSSCERRSRLGVSASWFWGRCGCAGVVRRPIMTRTLARYMGV